MAFKYIVQHAALDDIEDFARHIALGGNPERAARWRDGVFDRIEELVEAPESGILIPESGRLKLDYRQVHFHSHRSVYFIDEPKQTVVIVRVYQGARRPLRPSDL